MVERYLGYLTALVVANFMAYVARFDGMPNRHISALIALQAAPLVGLFILKNGRRVGFGDLIAVAFVGTAACVAVSLWSQAEMSRLFLALQLVFAIGTLLVAHVALGWTAERR